jgi:SAM-dependent methyltransferase
MDKKLQTIETYNKSAKQLADKFDSLGARTLDIEEVFALIKKPNPKVLEIGCGNGRDAIEILRHTEDYLGVDISEELIRLAQQKIPHGKFVAADIESFKFPKNLDVIFSFASLIHVHREAFGSILKNARAALNPSGIFRISLKYNPEYREVTKEDEFGIRTYYYYSDEDIRDLAKGFSIMKNAINNSRGQKWLEVLLQS